LNPERRYLARLCRQTSLGCHERSQLLEVRTRNGDDIELGLIGDARSKCSRSSNRQPAQDVAAKIRSVSLWTPNARRISRFVCLFGFSIPAWPPALLAIWWSQALMLRGDLVPDMQATRRMSSVAAVAVIQTAWMGRCVSRVEVAELVRPSHGRQWYHAAVLELNERRWVQSIAVGISCGQ
jgi:hypothetical protein